MTEIVLTLILGSLLFSARADRVNGQPPLNPKHAINMKEASGTIVVAQVGSKRKSRAENLVGRVFGKLTVIEQLGLNKDNNIVWLCKCDCGNETKALGFQLRSGARRSCRCLMGSPTHGASRVGPKRRGTPEYKTLGKMMSRCYNKNNLHYANYGGRGIKVCDGFNGMDKYPFFFEILGPKPTPLHCIDRIENDLHYSCGKCDECMDNGWKFNCQWATRAEEMRNTRATVKITFRGETLCRRDMANKYGIPDWTVKKRIKCGWSVEDALLIPVGKNWGYKKRAEA